MGIFGYYNPVLSLYGLQIHIMQKICIFIYQDFRTFAMHTFCMVVDLTVDA